MISGIKIKEIKLDAAIDPEAMKSAETGEEIISCIESSKGEITLAERDINEYFASGEAASGFSGLAFDFTPKGYKAKGRFEAELLVLKLDLDLKAEGKLGLKSDGVYLEDTVIYAEGARQSDTITELVTDRVNPLLSFSEIPFPVEFSRIRMTNDAVTDDERRGDDVRQSRQSQNRRKLALGKVRKTKCSKKSGLPAVCGWPDFFAPL